jgi:O-antigen/teichoic acid export membrane protein
MISKPIPLTPTKGQISRLFGNMAFVLSSDTITRAATLIIYVLVGRYLGTKSFGQMSLALTLLVTFQVLASAGLRLLIIREVAADRNKTESFLINGSLVAIVFSIISLTILILLNKVLAYSPETSEIIIFFGLGLLPFSLSTVCEAIFQAWERMGYIVLANLPRNLLVVGLSFWLLSAGYGLKAIAVLLLISNLIMLCAEWWIILRRISSPKAVLNIATAVAMTRTSITFLGFQAVISITASFIYIIISIIVSETDVGLYNAATQIITPVALIYESLAIASFPLLCQSFRLDLRALKHVSDRLIELALSIALPATIGLFYLGKKVLLLIYAQKDFARSGIVLQIMAASLIMSALSAVLGRVLLASLQEKILLRVVLIKFFLSIISSFVFIKAFGLLGAAINFLVLSILDTGMHLFQVTRLYPKVFPWPRLWKTIIASIGMTVFLNLSAGMAVVVQVVAGGLIYGVLWLALSILSAGNIRQLRAEYFGV